MSVRIAAAEVSATVSSTARLLPLTLVVDSIAAAIERVRMAGGVDHVLVTRTDGLAIAHNLPDADRARRLAAMAAAIVGTGEMAAADLGRGDLRVATIDTAGGHLVCVRAGPDAIVAGLGGTDANANVMLQVLKEFAVAVDQAILAWQDGPLPRARDDAPSGSRRAPSA